VNDNEKQTQAEHLMILARDTIFGSAQAAYGDPATNHAGIAALWRAYFGIRADYGSSHISGIDGEDVAMCFLLAKIARASHRSHRPDPLNEDTFVDMIGYAAIAGQCREERIAADLHVLTEGSE